MKFSGVTILQGVEFPIFLIHFAWALQQQRYCAACDYIVNATNAIIKTLISNVMYQQKTYQMVTGGDIIQSVTASSNEKTVYNHCDFHFVFIFVHI